MLIQRHSFGIVESYLGNGWGVLWDGKSAALADTTKLHLN